VRLDLIPPKAIFGLGEVLTFGLSKGYGENSWKNVDPKRYKAAAMRHWFAYMDGQKLDPESGKHHLYHAICCMMFIILIEEKK